MLRVSARKRESECVYKHTVCLYNQFTSHVCVYAYMHFMRVRVKACVYFTSTCL